MSDTIEIPQGSGTLRLSKEDIENASEWEEFVSLWTISQEIERSNQWYKGDIADRVAIKHGESSLRKFAEEVKESHNTLGHYRRVSRAFPDESTRNLNLSWTHYLIASFSDSFNKGSGKFDTDNRFQWLEDAHDNGWTTGRLEKEIKKANQIKDDTDYYDYYMDYLRSVDNVIMHAERSHLTPQQKQDLIDKLLDIYNRFRVYLME